MPRRNPSHRIHSYLLARERPAYHTYQSREEGLAHSFLEERTSIHSFLGLVTRPSLIHPLNLSSTHKAYLEHTSHIWLALIHARTSGT